MKGTVKAFNQKRGFGFIAAENGKDVFFHYSQLLMQGFKTIKQGTKVQFDLVKTEKGLQAQNIIKL